MSRSPFTLVLIDCPVEDGKRRITAVASGNSYPDRCEREGQRSSQKGSRAMSSPSSISGTATTEGSLTSPVPKRVVTRVDSARVRRPARIPTARRTRHGN